MQFLIIDIKTWTFNTTLLTYFNDEKYWKNITINYKK